MAAASRAGVRLTYNARELRKHDAREIRRRGARGSGTPRGASPAAHRIKHGGRCVIVSRQLFAEKFPDWRAG